MKCDFRYEERICEGKAVGIITIPKQKRPFYLANTYGALKSNVVYVRRGSSTDEAEPPEIAKMVAADVGRGNAKVQLSILNTANESLPDEVALRFLQFETMPDYSNRNSDSPYNLVLASPDAAARSPLPALTPIASPAQHPAHLPPASPRD